jgi:hypothetical protein
MRYYDVCMRTIPKVIDLNQTFTVTYLSNKTENTYLKPYYFSFSIGVNRFNRFVHCVHKKKKNNLITDL